VVVLIVVNAVIMCLHTQYNGFDTAYSIGYPDAIPSEDNWHGAAAAFEFFEWFFGVFFTVELLGKIITLKCKFPKEKWNNFDAIVVVLWYVDRLQVTDFNPTAFRVARLARVLRIFRALRWVSATGPLQLIIKAISSSIVILFWSLLVIFSLLCVIAMIMCNSLSSFIRDGDIDIAVRTSVFEYWGTFTRATHTMFEVTLANWGPRSWQLTNEVSEWYALFFICYKCIMGFAVVQVILAVFMQQTFKTAAMDEQIMIDEKKNQAAAILRHITRLFAIIDTSGDGKIDSDEFTTVMHDPNVKTWLGAIGLEDSDVLELFSLIDDGDGSVGKEEFIEGVKAMRGFAKGTDMFAVKRMLKKLESVVMQVHMKVGCLSASPTDHSYFTTPLGQQNI